MNKTFEEAARASALQYYNRMVLWQWLAIALIAAITGLGVVLIKLLVDYQALIGTCAS